jgi:hypothetical protein
MDELPKIDFSMLSTGEQVEVKRIRQKVETGQIISEKEKRFIRDMSSRGRGPVGNRKAELSYTSQNT